MELKDILKKKTVVFNPPVELQGFFIDNPVFCFHSPAVVYESLRKISDKVFYIDSFAGGRIVRDGNNITVGDSWKEMTCDLPPGRRSYHRQDGQLSRPDHSAMGQTYHRSAVPFRASNAMAQPNVHQRPTLYKICD